MRVLHVTRDLPPRTRGGLSVAVGGLVAAAAVGAEQRVISFDRWRPRAQESRPPARELTADGVACLRLWAPSQLDAAAAFAREAAPDLVIVHHGTLWEAARAFAPGRARALFVHVLQDALNGLRGVPDTMSAASQRAAIAEADAVWLPSEAARAALGAGEVLPLGITPSPPPNVTREPDSVLCVGRFDVSKGTADALAMVAPLLAARPRARLSLIGGLPDTPRTERRWRERWEAEASSAARGAVTFGGWQPAEAVARAQAAAAVVLAPSHLETFGLAVLEAQALGATVVASDIPAHRELIEHGVDGMLARTGDPAACARVVLHLLGDDARRARIGAAAAARAASAGWAQRIGAHLDAWERASSAR